MALERKRQRRIPPIVKRPTGNRFSEDAATRVISLARGILLGERGLPEIRVKKPTQLLPRVSKRYPEKAALALRLLRETSESQIKVAEKTGLPYQTVGRIYLALRKRGENIPVRIRGGWRDPRRITGALSSKRIEQIMQAKKNDISNYVNQYCWFYRGLFLKAGILPETIVDYVTDGLRWKLKTIRRERLEKAADPELMIKKRFNWNLKRLVLDQLKIARRKTKRMEKSSLEKVVSKKGEGKVVYLKEILPAAETVDPRKAIELVEQMSKAANLTAREKAVIYGVAAGLRQHEIARIAGVCDTTVSNILASAKTKIKLASKNNSLA